MPGVLPARDFIVWPEVHKIAEQVADPQGAIQRIRQRLASGEALVPAIERVLSREPNPANSLRLLFLLLGHTRPVFVTREYEIDLDEAAQRILRGDEAALNEVAEALLQAGIVEVLRAERPQDVAMGVRIGLDTHRRKSSGGKAYSRVVSDLLDDVLERLLAAGIELEKRQEYQIDSGDGLKKTVDFALVQNGRPQVVIEANFYTGGGSKPSEIVRSYAELSSRFEARNVAFVWITDGRGWRDMANVVREMPRQVPNIYTTRQARQHLAEDLEVRFLSQQG